MPDEKDTADFLQEFQEEPDADSQPLTVEFSPEENPLDLREEQDLIEAESSGIPTQPNPAGFNISPALEEDPYRDMRAKIEERFQKEYNEKTIEVTEEERRRFLRSALNNSKLWFDIPFPALNTVVRVVAAPPHWSDTASQSLRARQKEGAMDEDFNAWLDGFQLLHIWMQVDTVDGVPMPWFQAALEKDETLTRSRAMLALLKEDATIDAVRELNSAMRYLLISAVRIAEVKNCICMDALSDGSFFSGAGTN